VHPNADRNNAKWGKLCRDGTPPPGGRAVCVAAFERLIESEFEDAAAAINQIKLSVWILAKRGDAVLGSKKRGASPGSRRGLGKSPEGAAAEVAKDVFALQS